MKHPSCGGVRLSVCLIVKNEERWLADCLKNIKPVTDEIILVDTGSSDQSCTIAKQYGAKIFHFEWQDDFAAARNFSLEQAAGNWILILDADEGISSREFSELQKLIKNPATEPVAYHCSPAIISI